MSNVLTSPVFDILRKQTTRNVVLEGSSSSTKTYSIIQHLLSIAIENSIGKNEPLQFLILRSRLTWLKSTVLDDFKKVAKGQFGIWNEDDFNKKDCTYQIGNAIFIFGGLDHEQGQKFHGMRNDYVWFNEANETDWHTVRQVTLRLKRQAFYDYNPNIPKTHWLLTNIRDRKDTVVIHSTYKDNPFLEESIIQEIEGYEPTPENIARGTADESFWKIYGLGKRADIKGLIFSIKTVEEFPKVDDWGYGMDFGFSNDPSTLIKCAEKDGQLYLHEELYERGLTNIMNPHFPTQASLEQRFNELNIPKNKIIWADSEDAKAIQDLQNCGWDVRPVVKGAGSIVDGIMSMKRYPINVTISSVHLTDEFYKYKWKEDRSGNCLNQPVDAFNHGIDGARYWEMSSASSNYSNAKPYVGSIKINMELNKYGY